jgi:hypothetical protein
MIDPKQGPLFYPRRTEDCAGPSCHRPSNLSTNAAPEVKNAGKQPCTSKRQFSLVGS